MSSPFSEDVVLGAFLTDWALIMMVATPALPKIFFS